MMSLLAWGWMGLATAQTATDWTEFGSVLLTGADVPFGSTIGNPSVVYDTANSRYFMFFETFQQSTANCPAGEWSIGFATSTDGLAWTVNGTATLDGDPTSANPTYFSCVAAHPGAIYVSQTDGGGPGGTIHLFFKAEQASDACTVLPSAPIWGCNQYTGIGRHTIRFRADGSILSRSTTASPAIRISDDHGYPHPMVYDGKAYLAYSRWPDVWLARANNLTASHSQWNRSQVMSPTNYAVTWMEDEFFNPAMTCRDSGSFPLELFVGGRDVNFGIVQYGGLGKATAASSAPTLWSLGTSAQFEWAGASGFRHWDILRVGVSDYLLYFDEKDVNGNNQVKLATTLPSFSWSGTDVHDKRCP